MSRMTIPTLLVALVLLAAGAWADAPPGAGARDAAPARVEPARNALDVEPPVPAGGVRTAPAAPAPSVTPLGSMDPLSLAMRLIPVLKQLLTDTQGFDPRKEVLLQTPFRSYSIPAESLARFKKGDPSRLLVDDGRLLYPVMDIKGDFVSSIHLQNEKGLWTELGYDAKNLTKALREARQLRALDREPTAPVPAAAAATGNVLDAYFHVHADVRGRRLDFLGETGRAKGKETLLLTPLFSYPGYPQGTLPAEDMLRALKK